MSEIVNIKAMIEPNRIMITIKKAAHAAGLVGKLVAHNLKDYKSGGSYTWYAGLKIKEIKWTDDHKPLPHFPSGGVESVKTIDGNDIEFPH